MKSSILTTFNMFLNFIVLKKFIYLKKILKGVPF